jgi:hypothetical protein
VRALSRQSPFSGSRVIAEQDAMKTKQNGMLKHNDTPFQSVVNKTAEILKGRRGSNLISPNQRGYTPKSGDERRFANLHQVQRHDDRVGNDEDLYTAAKKRTFDRRRHRAGYNLDGDDQRSYFAPDRSKLKMGVATEAAIAERIAARQAKSRSDQRNRHRGEAA